VGEGQGQTKAFPDFLYIWTEKEQVIFILNLPQIAASTKPFCGKNAPKWPDFEEMFSEIVIF
jgi:hypothetical protein